jgi:hypothetical protein
LIANFRVSNRNPKDQRDQKNHQGVFHESLTVFLDNEPSKKFHDIAAPINNETRQMFEEKGSRNLKKSSANL